MKKIICFIIVILMFFLFVRNEALSQEIDYDIRLNEVMPDPEGSDTDYEWLEIYNPSEDTADLALCSIDGKDFPEGTVLESKNYLVITRDILDKDKDGLCFEQRWGDNSGVWGDHESEEYKVIELAISMKNSDDSIDLICLDYNDKFFWIDSISGQSFSYTEDDEWVDMYDITPGFKNDVIPPVIYTRDVIITEVYPSPDTSLAETEWIELYNMGKKDIDLGNWSLKDSTKSMKIEEDTIITKESYIVFDSDVLNFTLNNSGEEILLIDPNGDTADSFNYPETKKGYTSIRKYENFSYSSGIYQTQVPSIGKENIYIDPSDLFYGKERVNIEDAHNLEVGEYVFIQGNVSVELGVLGEKLFYIQDESGGIQIYLKDTAFWKEYKLSNELKIYGELKESSGERKIYIDSENSILKVEIEDNLAVEELDICDIGFQSIGRLVFVTGQITQTSGKTFFIGSEECEIKVLIKDSTAIETPDKKKGQYAGIIGIISNYGNSEDSLRILPRYASDIVISDEPVEFGDVLAVTGSNVRTVFISGVFITIFTFVLRSCLVYPNKKHQ